VGSRGPVPPQQQLHHLPHRSQDPRRPQGVRGEGPHRRYRPRRGHRSPHRQQLGLAPLLRVEQAGPADHQLGQPPALHRLPGLPVRPGPQDALRRCHEPAPDPGRGRSRHHLRTRRHGPLGLPSPTTQSRPTCGAPEHRRHARLWDT
jgi:hypothetical protein